MEEIKIEIKDQETEWMVILADLNITETDKSLPEAIRKLAQQIESALNIVGLSNKFNVPIKKFERFLSKV